METLVYEPPKLTALQRETLYKSPDARDIFHELSPETQSYLRLNWQSANPALSRDERKVLRGQVQQMAMTMFGDANVAKPYSREIQRYSNILTMEVWGIEDEKENTP